MINVNSNVERDGIISDLLPDLTPLLDVMFMLIIFLVLTTNAMQQVFDVSLPEDKEDVAEVLSENETLKITIFAQGGKWAINDEKFADFSEFKVALVNKYNSSKEQRVIIFGDEAATIDRLMELLTFMRSKGIEAADIVMK
jgi:biopolymer transport protein ExbD